MKHVVYFDWNATPPPLPQALEAAHRAASDSWGNSSSVHAVGRHARKAVEDAREAVACLLGRHPRDVVFTSGGTEANNLALQSLCIDASALITSRLEHPSVVRLAESLETRGLEVCWIPVGRAGQVCAQDVARLLKDRHEPHRVVVALQAANHETGVIQPIPAVIDAAHAVGARVHVDAVQAAGKMSSDAWRDADTVAIACHKLRGPKGIGAVATHRCARLQPFLRGGEQENGLRPGTVSTALAVGFGVAARWASAGAERYRAVGSLRDELEAALVGLGGLVNGDAERLSHVSNVSFSGTRGDEVVAALDVEGLCVSSGSACSAGTAEHSPVIAAMLGVERAQSAVRVSLGETTSRADIERAISVFRRVFARGIAQGPALLEVPLDL